MYLMFDPLLYPDIKLNVAGGRGKPSVVGSWLFRGIVEAVRHRYAILEWDQSVVLKLPYAKDATLAALGDFEHATLAHWEEKGEVLKALRWAVRAANGDLRPLSGKAVQRLAKGSMSDVLLASELVPVVVTNRAGQVVKPAVAWASCGFLEAIEHCYEVLEDPEDPSHAVVLKLPERESGVQYIDFQHATLAHEDTKGGWAPAMRWAMRAATDERQAIEMELTDALRAEKKAKREARRAAKEAERKAPTVLQPDKDRSPAPGEPHPGRQKVLVERVVRDTAVAAEVKRRHDYRCQVCGSRLETPTGPYAEGAHVRPLGSRHDGPDVLGNVLCLCPNHHVLFDYGAFSIRDDLSLIGLNGTLRTVPTHRIDKKQIRYHREKLFRPSPQR
jgi:hypothetical protein